MIALTEFEQEVYGALDGEFRDLREIAERAGHTLSGSGWENVCDRLVAQGLAEREHRPLGAPMGKVYRRKAGA